MARARIYLSADYSNGEGKISPASEHEIRELIRANPLLAADILSDWVFDLVNLYDDAAGNIFSERPQ
jgi:hypothetical protein